MVRAERGRHCRELGERKMRVGDVLWIMVMGEDVTLLLIQV